MPNPPIIFPASFATASAVVFANPDNSAQAVSADAPLPVTLIGGSAGSGSGSVGDAADAAASSDSGTFSLIALTKRLLGKLPGTLGQKTMALSFPVTLASDSAALSITAASLPLPAGAATAANQSTALGSMATISSQLPSSLGQKVMAQSLPVTLASDSVALGVTVSNFPSSQPVTAASLPLPAGAASAANQTTGNATMTTISSQLPASLGQKTASASLSATLASDLANLEPAGSAITGTTIPAGGVGLTGWLSAIYRVCTEASPVSGSVTSATTVVSASNTTFMGGTFQVTSAGTTCTISYEQSNDNATWVALPVISAAAANAAPVTTSTALGIFSYASAAAFVRARVSTYGSGTVSVVLNQKQQSTPNSGISLAAGSASIGSVAVTGTVNVGSGFTDSTTALAASGTFTGTGRASSSAQYAFFNATAFADQAGTLLVDQSLDTGATYQPVASQAVTAGSFGNLAVRLAGAFGSATLYRVRFVNGATAQATFRLSSSFSAS